MSKAGIILIGGGGHCHSCIDVIEHENKYLIKGIVDVKEKVGEQVLGYPIIGSDEDIPKLALRYDHFLITLAHIKNPQTRERIFQEIKLLGKNMPVIVSPLAHVSKHSMIEEGTIIMHHAIVNANSSIGANCIINSKALIEHDVTIGFNNHVSTASTINGNVIIGDNCFIGSRATLANGIRVANEAIIGTGSVVLKTILNAGTYYGVPAIQKKYE